MGRIIFKEMYQSIRAYRKEKKLTEVEEERIVLAEKEKLLMDTYSWVSRFSWLSHTETKLRVKLYITNAFSCADAVEELNRQQKGNVSLGAFRVSITYASDKLKSLLGDNFCELVDKDFEQAQAKFKLVTGNVSIEDSILSDVSREIKGDNKIRYALCDCIDELYFLVRYNKISFDSSLSALDMDKLRYLKRLVSGNDSVALQEGVLIADYIKSATNVSKEEVTDFIMNL